METTFTILAAVLALSATAYELFGSFNGKNKKTKHQQKHSRIITVLTFVAGLSTLTSYAFSRLEDSVNERNVESSIAPKIEDILSVADFGFVTMMSTDWDIKFNNGERISNSKDMQLFLSKSQRENFVEIFYMQNQIISKDIDYIGNLSSHVDTELIRILGKVENSRFFKSVDELKNGGFSETDNTFLYSSAEFYYDFWKDIKELGRYYEEHLREANLDNDFEYVGLTFGKYIQ